MNIETLDWDSDFFRFKVGKLVCNSSEDFDFDAFKIGAEQYKIVYVFSKHSLTHHSLKLVDEKVVLEKQIDFQHFQEMPEYTIDSFREDSHNFEEIRQLALESGVYSRFNVDQNFNKKEFEKLYTSWIKQSIQKKIAFDVLVATKWNNVIVGFMTLNKKSKILADIGLVAVSASERGKGIASQLLHNSFQKLKLLGYEKVQVVTQFENIPAMNLYQNAGFEIKERTFIYHYWNL